MSLKEELSRYISNTHSERWSIKAGQVVPDSDSQLPLKNVGVELQATILYADMVGSTKMVNENLPWYAAEMYKVYVYSAAKVIRYYGGAVTAYDGDRVMGVFIGDNRCDQAVKAALSLEAVLVKIIRPKYSTVKQTIGIDDSEILVAQTGIRNNHDYVWVGPAANNAAKMSALKYGYVHYITESVLDKLSHKNNLIYPDDKPLWAHFVPSELGYRVYGSKAYHKDVPS
jgi:class 3 adenylate cyclase